MQDRMRVAIDVSAVPARPAGAGHYVVALIAVLARRDDLALTLICRSGDEGRWYLLAPGATVMPVAPQHRPTRLAWEQSGLVWLLRRWRVDVYHAPHYTMPERANVPRVVTIHDLTFFDHPGWHERSKVPFFRRATRVAAKSADAIVCVSHATARRLAELCAPTAPVHVIPHGVDHVRFRPTLDDPADVEADQAILRRFGVHAPFVAYVGTIEPRKDVPLLIRAFDRVAGVHGGLSLVLAGSDGWGADAVTAAISNARHRGRIVRTGYVPDKVVPALLRQATAVSYASREEGFGLPALEALACGAPLVTTAGSAMQEVTGESALLVPPEDVDALAGALDMLVRGDAGLSDRQARGFAVAARHTWKASTEAHVRVYRSVAR